jgi:hypothetical protein
MKGDQARCASCNTDIRKKFIDEKLQKEISVINPNKFYFRELKEKAGKFGVGYSQALSSIRSETQLQFLVKPPQTDKQSKSNSMTRRVNGSSSFGK